VNMIIKQGWEAFSYGLKYQADMQRLDRLKLRDKVLAKQKFSSMTGERQDILREIMQLKDSIGRNPTRITIEAGMITSLIDDVETTVGGKHYLNPIEKAAKKYSEKLPKMVQNVGKVALMTQDSSAYKLANNATKMTDFIGRHVLYHYYTTAKGADHKEHKEAVAACMEEFVNFNLPTHRMIDYGNEIGFLWFTRYALRVQKVIAQTAMDKPFDAGMSLILSAETGLDNIGYSAFGMNDPFTKLGTPWTAAMDTATKPFVTTIVTDTLKAILGK